MNLNKEEQQFIADNITRYDVVTGITVDDIEVRIHGKAHGGHGKHSAIYRTANGRHIRARRGPRQTGLCTVAFVAGRRRKVGTKLAIETLARYLLQEIVISRCLPRT